MNCKKHYNFKNDHGQYYYICSGYKNYGSTYCYRNVVREEDLIHLIQLHLSNELKNIILNEEIIKEHIDRIEVDGDLITIFYKDGTISEWSNTHLSV